MYAKHEYCAVRFGAEHGPEDFLYSLAFPFIPHCAQGLIYELCWKLTHIAEVGTY